MAGCRLAQIGTRQVRAERLYSTGYFVLEFPIRHRNQVRVGMGQDRVPDRRTIGRGT